MMDEQEYQRLMKLDWQYGTYADPVKDDNPHPFTFGAYGAQDGDYLVVRWYSAQPAPEFDKLPSSARLLRYEIFLSPHYQCFQWISGQPDLSLAAIV